MQHVIEELPHRMGGMSAAADMTIAPSISYGWWETWVQNVGSIFFSVII